MPVCTFFFPKHRNTLIKQQFCGEAWYHKKLYFVAIFVVFAPSLSFPTDCSFCLYQALWYKQFHQISQECTTKMSLTLAKVSYKFDFPSICNARSLDHKFFQLFFHKVRHQKMRKVADLSFWRKVQMGSEASKSPKYESLGALAKNFIQSDIYFFLQYESVKSLLIFCKNNMFEKNVVLELWSKNLKAK